MNEPCLLDVNALVGLRWDVHSLHERAHEWFAREAPPVLGCALTELSFIRVSMADRTIAASFAEAELALSRFTSGLGRRYLYLNNLPPAAILHGQSVRHHREVTDHYLCSLDAAQGARLATLDAGIRHPVAWLIV